MFYRPSVVPYNDEMIHKRIKVWNPGNKCNNYIQSVSVSAHFCTGTCAGAACRNSSVKLILILYIFGWAHRGWTKKKCPNVFKSGGNILDQIASKP